MGFQLATLEERYRISLDELARTVREKNPTRLGLQLPEGLKPYALQLVSFFEGALKIPVFFSLAPCFGACDLRTGEFGLLGVELVLHFGHSEMPDVMSQPSQQEPETLFIELQSQLSTPELETLAASLKNELAARKHKTVMLTAAVQYVHLLPGLKRLLEDDFEVTLGKGSAQRLAHPGQVLGCNFSVARDPVLKGVPAPEGTEGDRALVFVGNGRFHPLGLALASGRTVLALEPHSGTLQELDFEPYLRNRLAMTSSCIHAENFGLLLSTKPGQLRLQAALDLKKDLEEIGKKAILLFGDLAVPEALRYLELDVIISTLCPRLALDDSGHFLEESKKPLLTVVEAAILVNYFKTGELESISRAFGRYHFDEI